MQLNIYAESMGVLIMHFVYISLCILVMLNAV